MLYCTVILKSLYRYAWETNNYTYWNIEWIKFIWEEKNWYPHFSLNIFYIFLIFLVFIFLNRVTELGWSDYLVEWIKTYLDLNLQNKSHITYINIHIYIICFDVLFKLDVKQMLINYMKPKYWEISCHVILKFSPWSAQKINLSDPQTVSLP